MIAIIGWAAVIVIGGLLSAYLTLIAVSRRRGGMETVPAALMCAVGVGALWVATWTVIAVGL